MPAGDYPRYVPQYSCACLPSNDIVLYHCLFPFSTKQSNNTHAPPLARHVILSWVESFPYLEIGVSKSDAEYFARVHVILMKLARHQVTTPAREINRTVLGSLTSRFLDEVRLYAMKAETLDLKDLENGLARAESFQSDQKRWNPSAHALAVARAGSGRTGAGGGARGRGRQGRRSGKRHDDGRGRNQQQGHSQQMHPGQRDQPPPWQKHRPQRYPQSQ